jgi:hypothetical protein
MGVSRLAYEAAIKANSRNSVIDRIAERMECFEFDCDVMMAFFDSASQPRILSVSPPGVVKDYTDQAFNSIGIACDIANSRLLWSDYEPSFKFGRALFDVFDAKANAEMSPGVGFSWDSQILFGDERRSVPKNIKELIERSWSEHNRSPFKGRDRNEDLPHPGARWRQRILELGKNDLERS